MIYQFKIQIRGIKKPPVWRRVQVPGHFTFHDFHRVIQEAFDWYDEHLYMFGHTPYDHDLCISIVHEGDWEKPTFDSRELTLEDFFSLLSTRNKLCYVYDFVEDWIHDITLEEAIEGESERATCIAGKSNWSEEETLDDWDDDDDNDEEADYPRRPSPEGFSLETVNSRVEDVRPMGKKKKNKKKESKKTLGRGVVRHLLFPAKWMKRQPYERQSNIDHYYIGLANSVLEMLDACDEEFDSIGIDRGRREDMAMGLTMWFEDVVSEGGIWTAFINECKKRYGYRLPFYEFDEENYYEGEVNLADVNFLLWHYIQYMHDRESVINPENEFIAKLACLIYVLFDTEFEKAPINDDWHDALHPGALAEPLLFSYREYLYKLINCNYLYLHLFESIQSYAEDCVSDKDFRESAQEMIHDYVTGNLFENNMNFLGLSMSQWGTEIIRIEDEALAKRLDTLKTIKERIYSLVGEDKEYFHLVDYGNKKSGGEDFVYKVRKDSFGIYPANAYKVNETCVLTRITCCEGEWNINGTSLALSCKDIGENQDFSEFMISTTAGKFSYERFLQASGGKLFVFPKNCEEAKDFYEKCLGGNYDNEALHLEGDDFVLYATQNHGLGMTAGVREFLKCADNPFYDKETAKENAFCLLYDDSIILHETACKMLDLGMLDDAALKSTKGYEYSRKFTQRNAQFFLDYFLHGKRDNVQ